jgi:hypothetical protein
MVVAVRHAGEEVEDGRADHGSEVAAWALCHQRTPRSRVFIARRRQFERKVSLDAVHADTAPALSEVLDGP